MKILGIVGSPRKDGNTYILIRKALDAAVIEGIDVEVLQLADLRIDHCKGCGICQKTGKCIIEDDLEKILNKMEEADGILIGAPSYFCNVPSLLKALIDRGGRVLRRAGKWPLRGKIGGAIVAARRSGMLPTLFTIQGFLHANYMVITGAGLAMGGFGFDIGDILKDEEGLNRAESLGRNMAVLLKNQRFLMGPTKN